MRRLDGKVAVITGAGSGVGRAAMVLFGREGAFVVGASRTQKNLDETMQSLRRYAAFVTSEYELAQKHSQRKR